MVFYEKTEIKNLLSELVLETVDDLSVDLRLGLACGGGTSSPFFNLSSDFAPFKELQVSYILVKGYTTLPWSVLM
jgi:hypothetical protein